jgi:hypothetical protein
MKSFQEFADEAGITTRFRSSNIGFCRLQGVYEAWRAELPSSARAPGYLVGMQRISERGVVRMTLSSGATLELKLRRQTK